LPVDDDDTRLDASERAACGVYCCWAERADGYTACRQTPSDTSSSRGLMMEIRRLRAVVSVILALALLLPNAVITVPSARAQQGPGFGGPMGMPGGYGQPGGFGGGDFGFGGGFGYGAGFYPSYPPPPAALPPSLDKGSAAPGVCTSQTYQTLAIPRGPEIRTVATKSTITPASAESGTKADVKREE